MSTETIDPEVIPMDADSAEIGDSVNVIESADSAENTGENQAPEADPEPIAENGPEMSAIASAESDVQTTAEFPGDVQASQQDGRTTKQRLDDAERDGQIEEATIEVCSIQEQLEEAKADEVKAIAAKKAATTLADSLVLDLFNASRRLGKLRKGRFPDPETCPLFDTDKPKSDPAREAINKQFPSPEAVQPLPAGDFAEHLRRRQRDTLVESMGLKKGTVKVLEELGLKTAGDIVRKWAALFEANSTPCSIKSITEKREEEIATALDEITQTCQAEWSALHPDDTVGFAEPAEPDEDDEDDEDDSMLDDEDDEDDSMLDDEDDEDDSMLDDEDDEDDSMLDDEDDEGDSMLDDEDDEDDSMLDDEDDEGEHGEHGDD